MGKIPKSQVYKIIKNDVDKKSNEKKVKKHRKEK